MASFEPMLDYCVVKLPRLPFPQVYQREAYADDADEGDRRVHVHLRQLRGGSDEGDRSLEQHVDSLIYL